MEWRTFAQILRKQTLKVGVNIMDRIMITQLLKQDGRIRGAVGFPAESFDCCVFGAKAVVISAGAGGFKPPGWPISELTSDGDAMAYRIGAEITGKEFSDPHPTSAEDPAYFGNIMKDGRPIFGKMINAEGNEVKGQGTLFLDLEFEAHAGRAPITLETPEKKYTRIGGGASGMSVHKAEGIWPLDSNCASSIPGLFAAGDGCGTMQSGALYASIGMSLCGASVTGARAGWGAAAYAEEAEKPPLDQKILAESKEVLYGPSKRKGGFSPRWVTQILQNTMIPYYIMYIKKENRLLAALTFVAFMRDHLVPKLTAKDPHELRLAHETMNMALNAEMRLRASICRTESRGCHYREDYPRRDDTNWLAWVKLKDEDGQMKTVKEPIPETWHPDPSKSYGERYPIKFPGE
jgi:succinate dehydrogenase/fumarate reductase flavoprotein subunit